MLPSELLRVESYPTVNGFVRDHLDMRFADVRAMLRLPLPEMGIPAGCDFAATETLMNLVSGISVILYTPTEKKDLGERVKAVLEAFYPWEPEEVADKGMKIEVLYGFVRHSLTHFLGVLKERAMPITIEKAPLTDEQIQELEQSPVRPGWVPLAVRKGGHGYIFSVPGLYWGVLRLTERLCADAYQMLHAEARLRR